MAKPVKGHEPIMAPPAEPVANPSVPVPKRRRGKADAPTAKAASPAMMFIGGKFREYLDRYYMLKAANGDLSPRAAMAMAEREATDVAAHFDRLESADEGKPQ